MLPKPTLSICSQITSISPLICPNSTSVKRKFFYVIPNHLIPHHIEFFAN
jgi:hypothetical protein